MASKNKNKQRGDNVKISSDMPRCPLVSVIIPVYNSAKFIPQTLESLLYQTLRDFEVVAVDDCSTDNSVEVVESFAEKFGGRLRVIRLPKNTGSPSLPRNIGIQMARGKYVAFLDSDDLFTKTALEELSTTAENFSADIIHTGGAFDLWKGKLKSADDPAMTDLKELTNPQNFTVRTPLPANVLRTRPFAQKEITERLNFWIRSSLEHWGIFKSFCRREFLILNQLFFPNVFAGEDQFFNFACICLAKNFFILPNIFYIVRSRQDSVMREYISDPKTYFSKRVSAFKQILINLEDFMNRLDFFKENPKYRYIAFDKFASMRLGATLSFYANTSPIILNDFVEKEFHSEDAAIAAYLFNTVNIYRLQIMKLQQELNALKNSK